MRLQISSRTLCIELFGMGVHDKVPASKPYITKCNAKHWKLWFLRTLPLDSIALMRASLESGFGICEENGNSLTVLCQL